MRERQRGMTPNELLWQDDGRVRCIHPRKGARHAVDGIGRPAVGFAGQSRRRLWRRTRSAAHHQCLLAVSYAIITLAPERADAGRLPALKRDHWAIENRLHRCKDASPIHGGAGPIVIALAGIRLWAHSQQPQHPVARVLGSLPTRA